jgi:hypothetical protein
MRSSRVRRRASNHRRSPWRAITLSLAILAPPALLMLAMLSSATPAAFEPTRDEPQLDWDHWFPSATALSADAPLPTTLPFTPIRPQSIDATASRYLSPNGDAIAFIYDSPTYGRLVIVEALPDIPDPTMRAQSFSNQVAQSKLPQAFGSVSIVSIAGEMALLTSSEDLTRSMIEVVKDGVQFSVLGPSLQPSAAVEAATAALGGSSSTTQP